ncbi:MAG: sugar ABC transporter permease [Lachnospiraceae bacterium]|nr:sugar ABC transporter permease [Lachnospiraceae bacterium]
MRTKRRLTLMQKRAIVGLLFISPWLIGFLIFYARSLFMTIQFSMSDVAVKENGGYSLTFAGISNFKYALTAHGTFKQVLTTSLGNMLVDVPLIIFFSLFMGVLLNKKFKGRTLVRAIFFLPVIMNSEAIQGAIQMTRQMMAGGLNPANAEVMESMSGGVNIDYYLELFRDLALPDGLLDYIIGAVARINDIITASGVQIVIFIAALQAVPPALYEVAKIEGATGYETFWKVTFPMVSPLIITNIVYTVVDSFINSDVVQLAYDTAFTDQKYGLSSSMSLLSTVAVCVVLVVACGLISKKTFYYN